MASEPTILSPTNLDVDHKGRIWVCEVVNYRAHALENKRPEGDRILILEDNDGDGEADTVKVYYQGRDIDAALGISVLGNKVIVTVAPNVIVFTDEDGDDVPDRKEYLFTETGIEQNDHSTHSFLFGPDGKLYWNMGNAGFFVHDKDGNQVLDRWVMECMQKVLQEPPKEEGFHTIIWMKKLHIMVGWFLETIWMVQILKFLHTISGIIMKSQLIPMEICGNPIMMMMEMPA